MIIFELHKRPMGMGITDSWYFLHNMVSRMKNTQLIIIGAIFLSSCISSQKNAYLNSGEDYANQNVRYSIGCYYDSLGFSAIDKIIQSIGNEYTYEKLGHEENYYWKNVSVKKISRKLINIKIQRQIINRKSLNNNKRTFESISIYIDCRGRDLLSPLNFRFRNKTKRFLLKIAD